MRAYLLIPLLSLSLLVSACSKSSTGTGDANGLSENSLGESYDNRFGSGSIPTAEGEGMFRDVHFDYDSAQISDEARQSIEYNVEVLRNNPAANLVLEGHCDARGTAEYNMALGNERARSVQQVLQSLGVSPDRLKTISYGEEVPLDPAQDDIAFAKNRRVHFAPTNG